MVAVGGAGGPAAADVQVLLLGGVPALATGAAAASALAAWRRHAPYPPRAVVGGAGRHRTPAFLLDARLSLRRAKRRRIGVEVLVAGPLGGEHKDPEARPAGSGRRVRAAGAARGGHGSGGLCGSAFPLPTDGAWSSGVPLRVSRGQLRRARLLGTAASAVLLLAIDGVVVAVDQHAADERVRFEALRGVAAAQLRDALYDGGGVAAGGANGATPLPSAALRAPAALHLGAADVAALGGRAAEAAALGWMLERAPPTPPRGEGAGRGNGSAAGEWTLTGVPVVAGVPVVGVAAFRSWLASPPPRPLPRLPAASRVGGWDDEVAREAGGAAHSTPPLAVVLPPPFIAALAARACHTAVRFGDELPRAAAAALLRQLAFEYMVCEIVSCHPINTPISDGSRHRFHLPPVSGPGSPAG
ncbi:hypothetical protein I4F81_000073 [Pyropia yezoensis]|uniref:Uncharacterized protein n=1 Tax=Pyropia yezoensis TaxID=2788 RepID=A0ACC3BI79_PYRYE|nr:hypothetical protein I4F81_000073 [Neopyropia yezoensis]